MNNLTWVALAGIGGYAAWKVYDKHQRAGVNASFTALLNSDEPQVKPENKLNVAQTAANLTDLYFRKNPAEITLQAGILQGKNYMKTATMLLNYSASLTPKK